MSPQTKRWARLGAVALGTTAVLYLGYRAYTAPPSVEAVRALAAEVRQLPKGEGADLRAKLRASVRQLPPEQRRQVFGPDLTAYFKLSAKEKTAFLDAIIKRQVERQKSQAKAKAKTTTASLRTNTSGGNNANGGNTNNGGNRPQLSPEQRAAARRARLDQTSPEDRAQRAAFFSDMNNRRQQLGLGGGGGGRGR